MGLYPPGSLLELTDGRVVVVTAPLHELGAPIDSLLVMDRDRNAVDPEPISVDQALVATQLLPQAVGIDPASLLDVAAEAG